MSLSDGRGQLHGPVTLAQSGNESKWNMGLPQVLMATEMHKMPMMFMTTPVLALDENYIRGHRKKGYYTDNPNKIQIYKEKISKLLI